MDFVRRNFLTSTSTTVERSDEQLFFDKDGRLEFAPDDPENPKNYSFGRKCYITAIAISLAMNATFSSSAPSGFFQSISDDLHVSVEAAGLVTTLFLLGYCAGPLFWSPSSEFYGRRWIFYISFTIYLAFGFLCAFAPNFAGLLVGRFLTGTAVSAALTNAPGILADIWGPVERGNAMILFATMTLVGPALGPVVSGFLQLKQTWRWTFYVLLWMAGFTEILLLLTLLETLSMIVLRNKARRLRKLPGKERVQAPVEASDRSLFFVAIYYAVKRGWNAGVGELPLIGTVIGACLGGLALLIISQIDQKKKKFTHNHKSVPEDRLPGAMAGGVIFAVTIFWFAWTAQYNSVHWAVPTVAGTFLATSILLIFVAFINYLIDSYLM
ncbi:MFS general substrate transporter [Aspergillus ellipticus CBS 707.79]|uniref:MFS general substrate transporter n=1 Tax=Aspergillus ellipticus CBS 707.79 TaxID=1448320 RepID=A0A319D390_9EURO|nr:MFS general substrate transporter [Aspergillus ellipticus CBS 707.79]